MREDIVIGKTKLKLWDFEHDDATTLYKVQSRQKVKNILVDCDYYESKGTDGTAKQISFFVDIKVFGSHQYRPIHNYEIYGNTTYTKYNHISRCTKETERQICPEDKEFERLERILKVINGEFEQYTVDFISCAKKLINNNGTITKTPKFILDVVEEIRDNRQQQKVIN